MSDHRSAKEIAATVRAELKRQLPDWKFSVVVRHHQSITVALMEGPVPVLEAHHNRVTHWPQRERVPYGDDNPAPGYVQLNHYNLADRYYQNIRLSNGEYLTRKGWAVLKAATQILNEEHWDKSDITTDYFCTNFYRQVHIGRWNRDYVVRGGKR